MSEKIFPEYDEYLKQYFLMRNRIIFLAENLVHTGVVFDSKIEDPTIDIYENIIEVSWQTYSCGGIDNHMISFPTSYLSRNISEINFQRDAEFEAKRMREYLEKQEMNKRFSKEQKDFDMKLLKGLLKKYPDFKVGDDQ